MPAERVDLRRLAQLRATDPDEIGRRAAERAQPASVLGSTGRLMVVAADHPARGVLRAGDDPLAMADRADLLDRLCLALSRPGVNGVLGTADVLDDLLLLGALEGKVVIGSMNRGGQAGAGWEVDDRFTGYDAIHLAAQRFQAGKMLLRVDPDDARSARTLQACADAVTDLADHGLIAMVEPFLARRVHGRLVNDLGTEAVVRSATVAAALGATSARTWLKLPVTDDLAGMRQVLGASSLPAVLLGGEVPEDADAMYESFGQVLRLPTALGLVVGRALLYPRDGDVAAAVDRAVALL